MIIYNKSVASFIEDCNQHNIRNEIVNSLKEHGINHNNDSEQKSWESSLPEMAKVLDSKQINKDIDVAIEYKLHESKSRIDFMVYGKNNKHSCLMIFELKQWSNVFESTKDNCVFVNTHLGITEDHLHPCVQAFFYKSRLDGMNKYVQENHVDIKSASYCHNLDEGYRTFMSNISKRSYIELCCSF